MPAITGACPWCARFTWEGEAMAGNFHAECLPAAVENLLGREE